VGHLGAPVIPGARCIPFAELEAVAREFPACIHLAGESLASHSSDLIEQRLRASLEINQRILGMGFARVIFASSAAVYGDTVPTPHREGDPVRPTTPYARVKVASEELFLRGSHAIARLCNVYGTGMATSNVVSRVLDQLDGDGPMKMFNLRPVRDFIHATDVARALAGLAHAEGTGIYNVGSGTGILIGEMVSLALELAGRGEKQVLEERPSSQASTLILNTSKLRAEIGWEPKMAFRDGLRELVLARVRK
jgi:UDP-glucose 4-epimerase